MALTEFLGGMAQKVADKFGNGQKKQPSEQDGNAPIKDKPQGQYGPNNEKLKELRPELIAKLQQLVLEYRLEGIWSQRRKIRRIRMARDFWNENQYCTYDTANDAFNMSNGAQIGPVSSWADPQDDATGPRYQFTTNWYQGYGLSFCALVSQDIPSLSIYPKSREVQEDVMAAKVGDDVADLIEQNNDAHKLLEKIGKFFWTDGECALYTRYVVDGERFGYKTMPVQGTRQVVVDGQPMTVPSDEGEEKIPLGQEVITALGGLEVTVPNYADDFHDCAYLQWNSEPHTARLKAAYPNAAKEIQADSGLTADQVYERIARLGVKQNIPYLIPGDALELLATFSRTWLRKWAFKRLDNEAIVAELEQLFPDGCYVAFAGLTYCESRSESIDRHWRHKHALPGDGQWRPAVGQALLSPQDRYNVLSNLQTETFEYGIPPIYADPQVLDFDALANQVAEPAVHFPARARPGTSLADGFFQPEPAKEPATLMAAMQELMGPVAQFLCGMFPAIFGGEMSDVKTASGYAMARDQAMGRLGLVWRTVKSLYAESIGLGLEIFKENRPEDVEVPFPGENDEEKAKWIRLADFKGNVMVQYEPDEGLPRLNSQQRAVLTQMLQMGADMPQAFAKALEKPRNLGWIKTVLGMNEMEVPGEDAGILAKRLIQQLIQGKPFQPPPQPQQQLNPATGLPGIALVPSPPQSSIPLDPMLAMDVEFIGFMLAEITEWAGSNPGQSEAQKNPAGYMNVYLYAKQLSAIVQQAQQAAFEQQMALKHAPPKPAAPPAPPKGPSLSMKVEDMPPDAAVQALAQDGIQVTADEFEAKQNEARQDKADELHAKLNAKSASQPPA